MESVDTVEIFKTNIATPAEAQLLVRKLSAEFPNAKFNVDLHDDDRVLRMQGQSELKSNVIMITRGLGFECSELF